METGTHYLESLLSLCTKPVVYVLNALNARKILTSKFRLRLSCILWSVVFSRPKFCFLLLVSHMHTSRALSSLLCTPLPPPPTSGEGVRGRGIFCYICTVLQSKRAICLKFLIFRLQLLYSTYKCIKTVRKYFLPISKRKFFPYITNTEAIHV